jgi:3-deoxy-D-manno-octulosonic-acid transferase
MTIEFRGGLGMHFVYNVLTTAALLFFAPYFLLRDWRRGKSLRNLPERLGLRFPPEVARAREKRPIWLHAVSVGEVLAAMPLARSLRERWPERALVVSTTTETGQALARERLHFADAIFYFPLDTRGAVRRAFRSVSPSAVLIAETEIWPNFLREARRLAVPVAFVNGRLSERSFRNFGWAPRGFLGSVFNDAQLFLMQSEEDARRLIALGAPRGRVAVTGNLKYDVRPGEAGVFAAWLEGEVQRSCRRPLLVAGSIMPGEEQAVLSALGRVKQRWPEALLLLAPRRPEQFDAAALMIEQAGWRAVRRSTVSLDGASLGILRQTPGQPDSVVLLDTLGELAGVYRLADGVFVGGSLVAVGGHNPLEPAAFGKAPVFGSDMKNFQEVAADFLREGAAVQVRSGAELGAAWLALLENPQRRAEMGVAAQALVERRRGATAATLDRLTTLLGPLQAAR